MGFGIAAGGAYIGNPIFLAAGAGLGISVGEQAARDFFPEKFCASDARKKLRSELRINEVEGESLMEALGKPFGIGKSAVIVQRREADLNNMLRSVGARPEAFEPPSLFRRFQSALGFQQQVEVPAVNQFQSAEFQERLSKILLAKEVDAGQESTNSKKESTPAAAPKIDNSRNLTSKATASLEDEQFSFVNPMHQSSKPAETPSTFYDDLKPSTSPHNPSGVSFFTWLKRILGMSNESSSSQQR